MQHPQRFVVRPCCQQSAGVLDQVARPYQVIAAEIFVSFIKTPRDGKAGDDSAEEILRFVSAKNRDAGAIQIFLTRLLVESLQRLLTVLPLQDIIFAGRFIGAEQGRGDLLPSLRPDSAKAEREDELAPAGR